MPEKCYEKLVSNLIQGVCVAIFAEYTQVENFKSGHGKLNSLFEMFSIQDTILDRALLKINFALKTREQLNNYAAQGFSFGMTQ